MSRSRSWTSLSIGLLALSCGGAQKDRRVSAQTNPTSPVPSGYEELFPTAAPSRTSNIDLLFIGEAEKRSNYIEQLFPDVADSPIKPSVPGTKAAPKLDDSESPPSQAVSDLLRLIEEIADDGRLACVGKAVEKPADIKGGLSGLTLLSGGSLAAVVDVEKHIYFIDNPAEPKLSKTRATKLLLPRAATDIEGLAVDADGGLWIATEDRDQDQASLRKVGRRGESVVGPGRAQGGKPNEGFEAICAVRDRVVVAWERAGLKQISIRSYDARELTKAPKLAQIYIPTAWIPEDYRDAWNVRATDMSCPQKVTWATGEESKDHGFVLVRIERLPEKRSDPMIVEFKLDADGAVRIPTRRWVLAVDNKKLLDLNWEGMAITENGTVWLVNDGSVGPSETDATYLLRCQQEKP